MIQPPELKLTLPVSLSNGVRATTSQVWNVLLAAYEGNLERVKKLVSECPELIYAQYNYAPPIHFAVREGHTELVKYLLDQGAYYPPYKIYPFQETLLTIATDRHHREIIDMLEAYQKQPGLWKYKGDNGEIHYSRTSIEIEFQDAVDKEDLNRTRKILEQHPGFAADQTYFWSEGILLFAAKHNNREMMDLLLSYGARMPEVLKWAQYYYFESLEGAKYIMEKGMSPNVMSWQRVRLLHDMAQKGEIAKAELLLKYGADIDPVDGEYQSTPLGMAVRWGHTDMVEYLIKQGADLNKAGASWATPLAWARAKEHVHIKKLLFDAGAR